jgi:hypothetical protein
LHDSSVFNEELGEISFSVLVRKLVSSPIRSNVDDVNTHFIETRLNLETARDLKLDFSIFSSEQGQYINRESAEVTATVVHFASVIRDIKAGMWRPYSADNCFKVDKKTALSNVPVPVLAPSMWREVHLELKAIRRNMVTRYGVNWLKGLRAVWDPE